MKESTTPLDTGPGPIFPPTNAERALARIRLEMFVALQQSDDTIRGPARELLRDLVACFGHELELEPEPGRVGPFAIGRINQGAESIELSADIAAMREIFRALQPLSKPARLAVLGWATARFTAEIDDEK